MSEVSPDASQTGSVGGVMRRVHGIETGYLNIVRIALAIAVSVGVLALGGAILWYAVVHVTSAGTHSARDYFEAPAWEGIRHRVLPTPVEEPASATSPAGRHDTPDQGRHPVDERIDKIADNLNAQFSRNAGDETGFTDRFPRRLLEAWVLEESGLSRAYLADYADRLISVSEAIGKDPQINRIGSIDDRARVIMDALDAFRLAFLARVEQAESRAAAAGASAAPEARGSGPGQLLSGTRRIGPPGLTCTDRGSAQDRGAPAQSGSSAGSRTGRSPTRRSRRSRQRVG